NGRGRLAAAEAERQSPATHPTVAKTSDPPAEFEVRRILAPGSICSVDVSRDGKLIASGAANTRESVILWNLADGRRVRTLDGGKEIEFVARCVRFSPDGKLLVAAGRGYDAKEIDGIRTKAPKAKPYESATARDFAIRIFSSETGNLLRELQGHSASVNDVSFSPDGKSLATGSSDGTIRVWAVQSGDELKRITTPGSHPMVCTLQFHPGGRELIAYNDDGFVRVYDVSAGNEQRHWKLERPAYSLALTPDGALAACGAVPYIRVFEVATAQLHSTLEFKPRAAMFSQINAMTFTHDGRYLIAGDGQVESTDKPGVYDGLMGGPPHISVIDMSNGRDIRQYQGPVNAILDLCATPDDKMLVSGSADGSIRIWKLP
ncbi:MAG TPA: WD40 repeat domain-containing protein, partial [Tepidisphaeraceae bacterium]|nr:WD40 repeat domain-containing protein [Tepidisphaeraceae bacterium]